jgi:translation initiation factor IF-1
MVGKILISHRVTRKLIKFTKILTEDKIIVELNPGKEFDLKQKA